MKRMTVWLLLAALVLAGCGAAETPPAEEPPAAETEEAGSDPALGEAAQAAYAEIAGHTWFTATVEEPDGARTVLNITEENAWNVEGPAHLLASRYAWYPAEAADWTAQLAAEERGYLLSLVSPDGSTAIRCCSGGDVVYWRQDGEERYARTEALPEDPDAGAGKLYQYLDMIAEDTYTARLFRGLVDGDVTDLEEVAAQLAEQTAEGVRDLPGWVTWKPADFQADGIRVFDVYRGEGENFCCSMDFRLLPEGAPGAWATGSGSSEPDGDGYYGWSREVMVRKNEAGYWYCADWGTGGCTVDLPFGPWEKASLEELTDALFLTEGFTHDWLLPQDITARSAEELAALPELLAGRTEAELRDFGAAMAAFYREYADYTAGWIAQEDLRTAMGPYAAYLDA